MSQGDEGGKSSIEGQLGDNEGGCLIIIISCILKERERQQARLPPFVFLSQPEIGHHFLWWRRPVKSARKEEGACLGSGQWAAVCLMNSTSFLLERRCNLKVVMKGVMMPASQAHAPTPRAASYVAALSEVEREGKNQQWESSVS